MKVEEKRTWTHLKLPLIESSLTAHHPINLVGADMFSVLAVACEGREGGKKAALRSPDKRETIPHAVTTSTCRLAAAPPLAQWRCFLRCSLRLGIGHEMKQDGARSRPT